MKSKLILVPVLVGAMLMPGCASPVANYLPFPLSLVGVGSNRCGSNRCRSCDSGNAYQYDDTAARNQLEEQIQQNDSFQNEQMVQQETAAAIQATEDATAQAAASAAASAAAGIGQ